MRAIFVKGIESSLKLSFSFIANQVRSGNVLPLGPSEYMKTGFTGFGSGRVSRRRLKTSKEANGYTD